MKVTVTYDETMACVITPWDDTPEDEIRYGAPLPLEVPDELVEAWENARLAFRAATRAITDAFGDSRTNTSEAALARAEQERAEFDAQMAAERATWADDVFGPLDIAQLAEDIQADT